MSLFKKAAVFTDLHFGKKSDSEQHNIDCLNYVTWFILQVKLHKCDTIIFMGDWFDNRSRLRLDSNWYSDTAIRKLAETGLNIYWIIGNHDLYYKQKRDIHSLPALVEYSDNITLINDITEIDDVLLCPWLVGNEFAVPATKKVKYVFGHFEFPLFLMNESVECPDHGGIHMNHFYQCEHVFSGHFHKRQTKLNEHGIPVTYIGNCFSHDMNDVNDTDRGCMILEWDGEPEYLSWEEGPRYLRMQLSELVELIETDATAGIITPNTVIECKDDLNIDLEQSLSIREELQVIMRDLRLKPASEVIDAGTETEVDGEDLSVEQLVVEHLTQIDTVGSDYESNILLDLFNKSGEN